ncbi:hypothetical protein GON26_00630 [Flavobacterium sp. GA093]|uniref:Lipoprotein n=1 Tax=Flavobacterium hydrocarbonoxydans TaxID=2683249 RepID=A0A6I4NF62_9FLAO|nr:hypothetical protein [Flavobacterium hydrocarbonoxydans]MWB92861.1 hypothetical protein [Flavobacterium hydrocarbonoxydans]
MKTLYIFIFAFLLIGCNNQYNPLDNLLSPETVAFQVLNKDNGQNLFTNGTYNPGEITITNLESNSPVNFSFITDNSLNLIVIENIGRESESINYAVKIAGKNLFDFTGDAILVKNEFSEPEYSNLKVENAANLLDKTTGVYKILVEPNRN